MTTPTPRTDECDKYMHMREGDHDYQAIILCRQLERELAAALERVEAAEVMAASAHIERSEPKPVREHPLDVVLEQALDEGLWFEAVTAPEAYLQQALRRLHAAVESASNNGRLT